MQKNVKIGSFVVFVVVLLSCKNLSVQQTATSETAGLVFKLPLKVELNSHVGITAFKNTQFNKRESTVPSSSEIQNKKKVCLIRGPIYLKQKIEAVHMADGHYYVVLSQAPIVVENGVDPSEGKAPKEVVPLEKDAKVLARRSQEFAGRVISHALNLKTQYQIQKSASNHQVKTESKVKKNQKCGFLQGWISAQHFNFPKEAFSKDVAAIVNSYNKELGKKIANQAAFKFSKYTTSGSKCYEAVSKVFSDIGIINFNDPFWNKVGGSHAYQFGNWANANSKLLKSKFKLMRVDNLGVTLHTAPLGSVVVFPKGNGTVNQPFSSVSGHIEIVTQENFKQSTSDFAWANPFPTAKVLGIYMPVK